MSKWFTMVYLYKNPRLLIMVLIMNTRILGTTIPYCQICHTIHTLLLKLFRVCLSSQLWQMLLEDSRTPWSLFSVKYFHDGMLKAPVQSVCHHHTKSSLLIKTAMLVLGYSMYSPCSIAICNDKYTALVCRHFDHHHV